MRPYLKETHPILVFSCKYCVISKNSFFLQNTSCGCFFTLGTAVLENIGRRNGKKHSHNKFSYNYLGSYNYLTCYLFCIVVLAVENSRKPVLLVTHINQVFYILIFNERYIIKKKNSMHFSLI